MCDAVLNEIKDTSNEIRDGGRAAEIHLQRVRDYAHQVHTLQKILPEVRLLAEHRGQDYLNVFDSLVAPWAAQALGGELSRLRYDEHLSQMHIVSLPEVHGRKEKRGMTVNRCSPEQHVVSETAATGKPSAVLERIERDIAEIKAKMVTQLGYAASPAIQVGGASGSGGAEPAEELGESPQPAGPQLDIPWQVGDGRAEGQHQEPVRLGDAVKGELEKEPWQFMPYKSGDATWLHAAQRRHQHRRRPNATIGVASVDLSGPHVATPMPGARIGSNGGRYFVVMVVRPDLTGGRKDAACQHDAAPAAGGAPAAHEAAGGPGPGSDPQPAEEIQSYNPENPLIYCEVVEFKSQAADAIIKMMALMREELGRFPTSMPASWTVHRLHSDTGQELLPKKLDEYCLDKGIRRTTTQGYDPSANGAAEQAVGFIKRKSRQLLAGTRLSSTWWGVAAKTAANYSRCDIGLLPWPRIPFGTRVMCVRDPADRDAFAARAHPSVVFGPSEAVPGGYVVYQDGRLKDLTNV